MATNNLPLLFATRHSAHNYSFIRSLKTRVAMSLLEVFLGISVLSIGILGSMSVMTSINDFRRMSEDESTAYALADQIAQRMRVSMGASLAPWQEHRRATTVPGETAATACTENDLKTANIIVENTGLDNVEVFVEYYSDRLISELASILEGNKLTNPTMNSRNLWLSAVGIPSSNSTKPGTPPTLQVNGLPIYDVAVDPPIILPRAKANLEALLSQTNSKPLSVIIRVLVSWRPRNAPENIRQWSEVTVAYRP